MEGAVSMSENEQWLIATLKELEPDVRAGALSAIIQCVGHVSEECGKEIKELLAEARK